MSGAPSGEAGVSAAGAADGCGTSREPFRSRRTDANRGIGEPASRVLDFTPWSGPGPGAMLARMSAEQETRFWHPFADMGAVRDNELMIDRGEDVWVWDADGRRYLDATASLWYCNVGHGRREIA